MIRKGDAEAAGAWNARSDRGIVEAESLVEQNGHESIAGEGIWERHDPSPQLLKYAASVS
jgi:hypothetical protein